MKNDKAREYAFPYPNEESDYCIFPTELECDPQVAFHGTGASILPSILQHGFRIRGELPSISFAKTSAVPLGYACKKRDPKGVVIAVRFASLTGRGVKEGPSCIHLYVEDNQPEIIGYCIVPEDYDHR